MPTELNFEYFKWIDYYEEYELNANGVPLGLGDPIGKEYNFNITIRATQGANDGTDGPPVAASTGIDPEDENVGFENQIFVPEMFNRFDITIDQLEGEINLPYIFERQIGVTSVEEIEMDVMGWNPVTRIRVPHSLLGGFTQFRINYQYIYYPEDAYQVLDIGQTTGGFVTNNSFETTRTIVPRKEFIPPEPEPIPPTIDPNQVREILADKIYEKFFNSDVIIGGVSDIKSIQTTTWNDETMSYGVGRETDNDPLLFFKKDRNTPENKRDFDGDGSDGIQQIVNDLLENRIEDGASGLQDVSDNVNNWTTITREDGNRESSIDIEGPELGALLNLDGQPTSTPLYYRETITYTLLYTPTIDINISVPFAEQHQFFQQSEGDLKQQIPNPNGTGTIDRPDEWANRLNISQLTLAKPGVKISRDKALTVLDTNIFELLPSQNQRQNEINNFFQRFFQLIGPKPSFTDEDNNGILETIHDEDQQLIQRISSVEGSNDPNAFITRTNADANDFNTNKTLESMRDRLNEYLGDVDTVIEDIEEQRPEYENVSEGFLKIRRLNQSIIVKSPIGQSSFQGWEQNGFTVTMWVRFLNTIGGGSLFTYGNPHLRGKSSFRLETLTKQPGDLMWKREASEDTNLPPLKYDWARPKRIIRLVVWENVQENAMLTDVSNNTFQYASGTTTSDQSEFYTGAPNHERKFGYLYDSSVPFDIPESDVVLDTDFSGVIPDVFPHLDGFNKSPTWWTQHSAMDEVKANQKRDPLYYNFAQYTDVPVNNLDEWFFICATYNPNIAEVRSFPAYSSYGAYGAPPRDGRAVGTEVSYGSWDVTAEEWLGGTQNGYPPMPTGASHRKDEQFWLNHKIPSTMNEAIVANSGLGNRCKVEIISRSDLLRARGYMV